MSEVEVEIRALSNAGPDRVAWLRAWEMTGKEPFAHPDYVELFTAPGEKAMGIVVTANQRIAILPIVLRTIQSDGWAPETPVRDVTSPYGYGGPYGDESVARVDLWPAFARWMNENEIASMFGRLALEAPTPRHLPPGATVISSFDNVVVDLKRSASDQWSHYEHKVRKNVKKARRANLHVDIKPAFTDLKEFWQLYESTMNRRGASSWYHFDIAFFSSLTEGLGGSYLAAEVRDETGLLVSAELVLCSDRYLYSFLGGTLQEAFPHAPNDLLKHAVIDYGRDTGRIGFVLGGGYTNDDGIFKYKKAFDSTGRVPFNQLNMVVDQASYDALAAERLRYERSTIETAQLERGFFPSYRGRVLDDDENSREH